MLRSKLAKLKTGSSLAPLRTLAEPANGTCGGDQFHKRCALAGMGSTCTGRRRISRVGTESARGTSPQDLLEAAAAPLALKSRAQRGPLRDSATGGRSAGCHNARDVMGIAFPFPFCPLRLL